MQELQEEIEGLQSKANALTEERQALLQAHEGSTGAVQALQAEVEQHEERLRRAQAAAEAAYSKHRAALSAAQEDLQKGASDWADEVGPVIYLGVLLLLIPHTTSQSLFSTEVQEILARQLR